VLAARGGGGGCGALPAPAPAQLYILAAAQLPSGRGGCRDKPGKAPDFYHTCYALAGLSVAVWEGGGSGGGGGGGREEEARAALQGRLFPTDCAYNVRPERLIF
jgi:protein farnesyltransferase subunit beta